MILYLKNMVIVPGALVEWPNYYLRYHYAASTCCKALITGANLIMTWRRPKQVSIAGQGLSLSYLTHPRSM